jgi:acyl carrier protein
MDIEAAVYRVIADLRTDRTADVGPGWRLIEENGVDSLFFVELVLRLEATLGISLPDEEVAGVQTAGELVALCEEKLVEREPQ